MSVRAFLPAKSERRPRRYAGPGQGSSRRCSDDRDVGSSLPNRRSVPAAKRRAAVTGDFSLPRMAFGLLRMRPMGAQNWWRDLAWLTIAGLVGCGAPPWASGYRYDPDGGASSANVGRADGAALITADASRGVDGDVDGEARRGDAGVDAGNTGTIAPGVDGDAVDGGTGGAGRSESGGGKGGEDAVTSIVPSCSISQPVISATHPILNGVPTALGGDRASADGAPYGVTFVVLTEIADGQNVDLEIVDTAAPSASRTVHSQTVGGKATFSYVGLTSGSTYEIQAVCLDKSRGVGRSTTGTYPVDATPPDLSISKPTSGNFIGPSGLTSGTFPVCGSTTSPDAINLDAALGALASNFCVTAGGSPLCKPVTVLGTDVCVDVPCAGDAAFDVRVTLNDGAGNVQQASIDGVSCFSMLPSVSIVSPTSDAPTFTDPSKHLLAASAPQAFRDQSDATAGAQTDVVACATRAGTLTLLGGHEGDVALAPQGAPAHTRTATAADGCPPGFGFAVTFAGVTLLESVESAATALVTATEVRVGITDLSGLSNTSPALDLWVDSVAPSLVLTDPVDLCGSYHQSATIYLSSEIVAATAPNVSLILTNSASTQTFTSTTFTTMSFPFVVFQPGETVLEGVVTDNAGNRGVMQPNPCVVTVGTAAQ